MIACSFELMGGNLMWCPTTAAAEHREAPLAAGRRPHSDFGSRLLWVLTVLTALGLGYVWLSPPVQVVNPANCQVRGAAAHGASVVWAPAQAELQPPSALSARVLTACMASVPE